MTAAVEVMEEAYEPDWARVMRVVEYQQPDRPLSEEEKVCAVWLMLDTGMELVEIYKRVPGLSRAQGSGIKRLRTEAALGDEAALSLAPPAEMRFFLGIRGICRPGSDLLLRKMFGDSDS